MFPKMTVITAKVDEGLNEVGSRFLISTRLFISPSQSVERDLTPLCVFFSFSSSRRSTSSLDSETLEIDTSKQEKQGEWEDEIENL